jgi:hypothetical protein
MHTCKEQFQNTFHFLKEGHAITKHSPRVFFKCIFNIFFRLSLELFVQSLDFLNPVFITPHTEIIKTLRNFPLQFIRKEQLAK